MVGALPNATRPYLQVGAAGLVFGSAAAAPSRRLAVGATAFPLHQTATGSACGVGLAARLAVVSGRGTSFIATVHALTTTVLRLTTFVALATSIDGRNFMPTTRSKAASFEDIAFSVFSEAPSHAAAPVLFDCLQQPDGLWRPQGSPFGAPQNP